MGNKLRVRFLAVGLLLAGCSGGGKDAVISTPPPSIGSIAPASSVVGAAPLTLTVTGTNFTASSVVQWNGSARPTTFGSSTQLTASITQTDLAIAGTAAVAVSNGVQGTSATVAFGITPQIANGIAMPGSPNDLVIGAAADVQATNVDGESVANGVVTNRLNVFFAHNATVDQVNKALSGIAGGVVSVARGFTAFTIGVPRQSSVDGLQALANHLKLAPGVHHVALVIPSAANMVFTSAANPLPAMAANIRYLLPGRFPAAWNLANPKKFGNPSDPQTLPCPSTPVTNLVNDVFSFNFLLDIQPFFRVGGLFQAHGLLNDPGNLDHGYIVAMTWGANAFGANPFSQTSECMDVSLVQVTAQGGGFQGNTDVFVGQMPPPGTKFVVNESMAYSGCADPFQCLPTDSLALPLDRAYDALYYKARTQDRWGEFLFIQAAGNDRDKDAAAIYPGIGDARFASPRGLAQTPDVNFGIVGDDALWSPSANDLARHFTSVKASAGELDVLKQDVTDLGLGGPGAVPDNIITVGSTLDPTHGTELSAHVTGTQMGVSVFSDRNPDVLTVGEGIPNLSSVLVNGTSFAAPQVAGLASYLWMLSPDLHNQPAAATKQIIVSNTYDNKFIDAYATVLALDGTTLSPAVAPMRLTLLDVNNDGVFDEQDIDLILSNLFVVDNSSGTSTITHQAMPGTQTDFSRYDLNGDGFTTAGARRERFDLDRVGSVQYGASQYSTVTQMIEDQPVSFDETALTDLQILCYYAYSPMFSPNGDKDARKALLDGRCALSIDPPTAAIPESTSLELSANSPGGDPVSWTASCGTINPSGPQTALYRAPATSGNCTITATSTVNNSLIATAAVTVNDAGGGIGSESGIDLDMNGNDANVEVSLFDPVSLSVTSTGSKAIAAPLNFTFQGSYHPDSSLPPADYKVTGLSDGPIVEGSHRQPASGSYREAVSCSNTGTVTHDENDNRIFPKAIDLKSGAAGSFEPDSVPGTYTVSFTMERGDVVSGNAAFTHSSLVGLVFISYSLHGEPEDELEFQLNDGTQQTGASPPKVSDSVTFTIQKGGFLQANWNIGVRCVQEFDKDNPDLVASKRSGTLNVDYAVSLSP